MACTYDHWLTVWVERVDALLHEPLTEFPHRALFPLLVETFEATPTWHEMGLDGHLHMEMFDPPSRWPDEEVIAGWGDDRWWEHPLTRWFMVTRSVRPMSTGRVPGSIVLPGGMRFVESQLRPQDFHQQLCLPVSGTATTSRNVVLAQGGSDFTDGQLELARAIQPLLMLLDRQVRAHGMLSPDQARQVAAWALTARETTVLRLVGSGLTTGRIAGVLGCSPRTVDKHLEHLYRKLGVRDRLSAARLALGCGLAERVPPRDEGTQPPGDRIAVVDGMLRPLTPELLV
jgi:DNA-binding CsgD family transcriptional regulator